MCWLVGVGVDLITIKRGQLSLSLYLQKRTTITTTTTRIIQNTRHHHHQEKYTHTHATTIRR